MTPKIERDEFSSSSTAKGRRYVRTDKVRMDHGQEGVAWVYGSQTRPYRVQVTQVGPGHQPLVTCNCPYGERTGGGSCRCSHAYAVLSCMGLTN